MLPDNVEIADITAQRIGLRQRHQMQMAIDFPEILDIPDQLRVTVVDELAKFERRLDAGLRIPVPARRRSEIDAPHGKDVQLARGDAVGGSEVLRGIDSRGGMYPGTWCSCEVRRWNAL